MAKVEQEDIAPSETAIKASSTFLDTLSDPLPTPGYSQSVLDLPVFKYAALQSSVESSHIRLLEVLDHQEHGLLTCRLHHVPPSLPYQALSYTWGRILPEKNALRIYMTCEHASRDGIVLVRESLYAFISMAASQDAGAWPWIDALCINQNDVAERNVQVQRMGEIYASAQCVNIWGLDINNQLSHLLMIFHSEHQTPGTAADAVTMGDYLTSNMPGSDLQRAMQLSQDHFDKLYVARKDFKNRGGFEYMRAAIEFSWDSECKDIRDKIYALLSITARGTSFEVDYDESCEQLLLRALRHFPNQDFPRFLDCATRLTQLLETRFATVYERIISHDLQLQYEFHSHVDIVSAPMYLVTREPVLGTVCPNCMNTIYFDQGRNLGISYVWCVPTGYPSRSAHVFFTHSYRRLPEAPQPPPSSEVVALNNAGNSGKRTMVPYTRLRAWVTSFRQSPSSGSRNPENQEPPVVKAQQELSQLVGKWRFLRCFGWKVSDSELWETEYYNPGNAGPTATLTTNNNPMLFRGHHPSTVSFSAADMVRFIFYATQVPLNKELADLWLGQFIEPMPGSAYHMLNPNTRVHLEHRGPRKLDPTLPSTIEEAAETSEMHKTAN